MDGGGIESLSSTSSSGASDSNLVQLATNEVSALSLTDPSDNQPPFSCATNE